MAHKQLREGVWAGPVAERPSVQLSQLLGQMWVATDEDKLYWCDGDEWLEVNTPEGTQITLAQLPATLAGAGLSGSDGSALAVVVDDSSIEIATDTLQVKAGGITRAMLVTETTMAQGIPLNKLQTGAGLVHTATPAANVFGIDVTANVQILKSEAADDNTKTSIAIFQFVLPDNYVNGATITLRLPTQLKSVTGTGVANNGSDIDAECYVQAAGAVGSDICATAAQTYAALDTYYNKDFTITPTSRVRGEVLNFKITTRAIENDAGNGTLTTHIAAPTILLSVKG